jgi:hypothetical protein
MIVLLLPFEETLVKKPGSCTVLGSGCETLSLTRVGDGEVRNRQTMMFWPPLLTIRAIPSQPVK